MQSDSFQIFMEEPDNEGHNGEYIKWIVMETGSWNLPDGTHIEAGAIDTSSVHREGNSFGGPTISFSSAFSSTPAVLHTLNSYNNNGFMSSVAGNIDTSSFQLQQEAGGSGSSASTETIGWIAMETGQGTNNGFDYEAGIHPLNGDSDGVDDIAETITFSSFTSTPDIVIKGNTFTGSDGYWARSAGSVSSSQATVYAEEDAVGDTERGHTDTGFGWIAWENGAEISLEDGDGPDISYDSYQVHDEGYGPELIGNNDGAVNAGEYIELSVTFENTGGSTANGVYANLSTSDSGISIINPYQEFGDIPAAQTKASLGNYSFEVDGTHSQGDVTFTLHIHDGMGNYWTDVFVLSIGPPIPYLEYLDSSADDGLLGDGVPNPGDTITLDMEILNAGDADASGVTAEISTDDPHVTVTDNSQNYYSISANGTKNKNGVFSFDIDPSHPAGETINFTAYLNETDEHYVDHFKIGVYPNDTKVINVALMRDFYYTEKAALFGINSVKDGLEEGAGGIYTWTTNNGTYAFNVKVVGAPYVYWGMLSYPKYDAFIIPGISRQYVLDGWKYNSFNQTVHDFVSSGGGYLGFCGGANAASSGLYENTSIQTTTMWEKNITRTAMHLVNATAIQDMADPYYSPYDVGQGAYIFYSEIRGMRHDVGCGASFNMSINTTHTIFDGYGKNYRNIMWGGGPAFHIPAEEKDDVDVLAWYPQQCLSSHPNQQLQIWEYNGTSPPPWIQSFDSFQQYMIWLGSQHLLAETGGYFFRTDWNQTNIPVDTYIHGKPAVVASTHGNGRVIASGVHPEFKIWESDTVIEAQDNSSNPLGNLFHWDSEQPVGNNWWMLRRMAAYVAGNCPDADLPPYPTEDAWWNSAWFKRKPVNLSVSSGSTNAGHQVKLHVNYDSDMNADFSDLRFIRYSDNTMQLDYWIEDKSDDSWADVWVKIPDSITTSDKTMAWMYYGNAGASSVSDGASTFQYFDHWTQDNTGGWTYANTGNNHRHWWLDTTEFTEYRELRMQANLLDWWSGAWDHTQLGWTKDKTSYVNSVDHVTVYFEHRTDNGANDSHVFVKLHIRNGGTTYTTSLKSFPKPASTTDLYLTLTYYSDMVSYDIRNMDTGQVLASDAITDPAKIPALADTKYLLHQDWDVGEGLHSWLSPTYLKWGNTQSNGGMVWKTDYWLTRRYHYPEPTYDIGGEEGQL